MDLILEGLNYRVEYAITENSFEQREGGLTSSLFDIDKDWATRIASALIALEGGDWSGVDPFLTKVRTISLGLRAQILTQGPRGTVMHGLVWPDPILNSLEFQASQHAIGLLSLGQQDFAAQLRYYALENPISYLDDIIIPSMLEVAEKKVTSDDLKRRLNALTLSQKDVLSAPRTLLGNRRAYVVRLGDSLRDIALALYGEEGHEGHLIRDRQLQPPFVSEIPRSGCLTPGARILRAPTTSPGDDTQMLGSTFALDVVRGGSSQEWDIIALPGGGIDYVSGMDCLITDAALRLATPLGSLQAEPRFGYPEIAGRPLSRNGAAQVMLTAETLLEDTRIESVSPRVKGRLGSGGSILQDIVIVPRRK